MKVIGWVLVVAGGLTGTLMVVLGMFEELPVIIRNVSRRAFMRRRRN